MKKYCIIPTCGFKAYFGDIITATVWAYQRAYEGYSTKIIDCNGFIVGKFTTNSFDNPERVTVKIRGM